MIEPQLSTVFINTHLSTFELTSNLFIINHYQPQLVRIIPATMALGQNPVPLLPLSLTIFFPIKLVGYDLPLLTVNIDS